MRWIRARHRHDWRLVAPSCVGSTGWAQYECRDCGRRDIG